MDSRGLSPLLSLESPNGTVSDAGLQVYADDVFERRVVAGGTAEEAYSILRQTDASFDVAMQRRGYVQNMSKRVVVPELRSPLENRKFQKLVTEAKAGQVSACARHLGGQ